MMPWGAEGREVRAGSSIGIVHALLLSIDALTLILSPWVPHLVVIPARHKQRLRAVEVHAPDGALVLRAGKQRAAGRCIHKH